MSHAILPLTQHHLPSALRLRDTLFPNLSKAEYATLEASILNQSAIKKSLGIDELYYWVALKDEAVAGLVGLYTQPDDAKGQVWLGWYGVDVLCRGLGLGSALLDFAIKEASALGFDILKLYTANADEYATARALYSHKGFVDVTPSKKAKKRYYSLVL
ncbi:MAG: hypothetical protein QG560_124 [Campylobacterota bacterium]|nr:hypothetical protein [Campylobacterota bacterium]